MPQFQSSFNSKDSGTAHPFCLGPLWFCIFSGGHQSVSSGQFHRRCCQVCPVQVASRQGHSSLLATLAVQFNFPNCPSHHHLLSGCSWLSHVNHIFWKTSSSCSHYFLFVFSGYIGPGGLHKNASFFNCTGGAAGYIDRTWLGQDHLITGWSSYTGVYKNVLTVDPEGVLGYLTSTFLVFLGLQVGHGKVCLISS
jgi:hypothetical protein